ncbi:MAG TPA: hypothetical protein VNU45_17895 [Rummeliibacillus sp.]|nr:hypothetical protein [Rummeliibacillus sp.]
MPTQLQLVNRTLSELGRLSVSAILESPDAQQANAKLLELVPELYEVFNWSFLVKFIFDNTPLTINFSPDYQYTYQLPGDFGHFFKWQDTGSQWPIYMITDGYLLAQVKPVGYYYIVNQAAPEVYSPLFARALVLYAAAKLAPTLTNNVQLAAYLEKEYEKVIAKAITQDDMMNPHFATPYNDFDRITFV